MDFEKYNEFCYGIPEYYDEPDFDYDESDEWDDWTDEEIREYMQEDRADELRLQAIIERGEAE